MTTVLQLLAAGSVVPDCSLPPGLELAFLRWLVYASEDADARGGSAHGTGASG